MSNKITFVISGLRGGGAEKVCVTLANGLANQGYDIDLVVLSLNGAVRANELSSKVRLVNLNIGHARYSFFSLWRYISTGKPATVLSFNRQLSVVLVLIRKLLFKEFRLVSRNIIYLSIAEQNKNGMWHGVVSKYLTKRFYSLSDIIVAQSHAMKEDLLDYLCLPDEKVKVIHNPISSEIESIGDSPLDEQACKSDYLLCVGRLEHQKAFHYAIECFSNVAEKYPNLRLKLVGRGSLESELRNQASALGVVDRVDFDGYQSNIFSYYLGAKATLLTSLYEGFPNILVESIALGTPVVAFDCPSGPSEIVINGVNGFLVKQFDLADFCNKIEIVIDEPMPKCQIKATAEAFERNTILDEYARVLMNFDYAYND
ncbi:glycosyltransferase [Halomonas sp. RT37]|uniref:Glycosyltransferase n=1 Tax=Halomonas sp. RT37 TaxID=2950872 RepID=A0AAU7KMK7_9GAMM